MRKICLVLIVVLAAFSVFAQQDSKAKEILDAVASKTKSYQTIRVKFNFVREDLKSKTKDSVPGTLFLKGPKYKLFFMGNETTFDGKVRTTYIVASNEANISEPTKDDGSDFINPADIFTIYQKNFKIKYVSEGPEKGKTYHLIDLFPTVPGKKKYSRIRLKIEKGANQLQSLRTFNKDGNITTIDISEFKPNVVVNDQMFIFDKKAHPKVEIIDLR